MVVPIYNAELAPKTLRGRLVSLNQLAITAGIMVCYIVCVLLPIYHPFASTGQLSCQPGLQGGAGRLENIARFTGSVGTCSYIWHVLSPRNPQVQ